MACVNIDYLIINFNSDFNPERVTNQNFGVIRKETGTKMFKEVFEIFYRSKKIATWFSIPHSDVMKKDFLQVQFTNKFLYESFSSIKDIVREFIFAFNLKFHSFNRVDICIDSNYRDFIAPNFLDYVSLLKSRTIIHSGKKISMSEYLEINGKEVNVNGFTLGSRGEQRYFRAYDKTLQIKKEPKPHIEKFWKVYGINIEEKIVRCEFELRQKYLKAILCPLQIFDREFLKDIFIQTTKNFIQPRYNQGKKRISDNTECKIFDFNKIETRCDSTNKEFEKHKPELNPRYEKISFFKSICRIAFRQYFLSQQEETFHLFLVAKAIKENPDYNLDDFVDRNIQKWIYDISKKHEIDSKTFDFDRFYVDFDSMQIVEI
jgi:hypothetical protein